MSTAEQEVVREVAGGSAIMPVSRAELADARANPRDIKRFVDHCTQLATLSEETADECIYALPRKEKDKATGEWVTKNIEGPSARFSEIVQHTWRNSSAGARVINEGREFITAQAVFHDLESNTHVVIEVQRRIVGSNGQRFGVDMIGVTGNAAMSIAYRNAVLKGVPKVFWNPAYEAARKACVGDARTLPNRRAAALARLQKIGATPEMVIKLLGRAAVDAITLDDLVTLQGIFNSIKEGETTVESAFAAPPAEPKGEDNTPAGKRKSAKDALRAAADKPKDQQQGQPPAQEEQKDGKSKEPFYSKESALAAIRGCKTEDETSAKYREVVADFRDSGRDLPIYIEAAKMDHIEAIKQSPQGKLV